MVRLMTVAVITAALLLGNAAMAAAGDFCLDVGGINTIALKGFALPGKGACKETRGFYIFGPFWVTGTACGSSDGDHITFFHTGVDDGGTQVITDKFTLNRTTLSGSGRQCLVDTGGGGGCGFDTWTKVVCNPKTVPVP